MVPCHNPCYHYPNLAYRSRGRNICGVHVLPCTVGYAVQALLMLQRTPCPISPYLPLHTWKCLWLADCEKTGTVLQVRFPKSSALGVPAFVCATSVRISLLFHHTETARSNAFNICMLSLLPIVCVPEIHFYRRSSVSSQMWWRGILSI